MSKPDRLVSISQTSSYSQVETPLPSLLVVDDRVENLIQIGKTLAKLEAEVFTARSGSDAISQCLRRKFSVIVIDAQMADMSGYEIADVLAKNEDTCEIPIIFLTGGPNDESHLFRKHSSVTVDYISKPFSAELLISKVNVFLSLETQRLAMNRMASNFKQLNFRNKLILDGAAMGILGIDGNGCINFINPAAQRLLAASDDLIGTYLHPLLEGADAAPSSWRQHDFREACIQQSRVYSADTVMHQTNGRSFAAEYTFSPMPAETGVTGGVLIFQDITLRKQAAEVLRRSEQKFRTVLENCLEGIVLLDERGHIEIVNERLAQMIGYSCEELQGIRGSSLLPERFHQTFFNLRKDYLDNPPAKGAGKWEEACILHRNGSEISVDLGLSYDQTEQGLTLSVVVFDKTEQNLTDEALRRSQRMDAIGQFTGGVAHDFNNILAIILGNLELLQYEEFSEEKVRNRLAVITKSAQRASQLTRQLLSFSNHQANVALATDINRVIGQIDHLISGALTPMVEFSLNLAEDIWPTAIDPGDFQDALLNLIINARDAMPGGGQLKVKTANVALNSAYCGRNPGVEPGDYVQVSVSDTGQGIPSDILPFVFEPFFSTKDETKGTGLGLAMVYGFTQRSRGHAKIYSNPGVGTTVRLFLPRDTSSDSAVAPYELRSELDPMPGGSETILLVDDEADLLDIAKTSLESLGYRILTACDGPQATEALASDPSIAMLLSDVVMPGGINGHQLAALARARHPDIRVLLTSGYTDLDTGADEKTGIPTPLLHKPYTQAQLALEVREQLDRYTHRQPPTGTSNDPSQHIA